MKIIRFSFLVLLMGIGGIIHAQTLDDVIAKHINAIGGEGVLNSIQSLYIESDVEMMGSNISGTTTIVNGKGYKMEMDMNGSKIIQCFNNNGGWTVNPMTGASNPEPLSEDQVESGQLLLDIGGVLHNYKSKNFTAQLDGTEKVGDVDALKVKVTKDSMDFFYYFDPTTYYLIQTSITNEVMGQTLTVITSYSDFQKLDNGFIMPYQSSIDMGMVTLNSTVKKVEVNKPIDPATFDMPGANSL